MSKWWHWLLPMGLLPTLLVLGISSCGTDKDRQDRFARLDAEASNRLDTTVVEYLSTLYGTSARYKCGGQLRGDFDAGYFYQYCTVIYQGDTLPFICHSDSRGCLLNCPIYQMINR